MEKSKPIAITREEGGPWLPFTGQDKAVHAIKFDDGSIWDACNGWRKAAPLTLQQKITICLAHELSWLKAAKSAPSPKLKAWAVAEADWCVSKRKALEVAAY